MRKRYFPATALMLGFSLVCASSGVADRTKLPLIRGKEVVAFVNDEPIFLENLARTMGLLHAGAGEKETDVRPDPSRVLDRMINVTLILQEAGNIGLDELPEVKNAVDVFRKTTLREMLFSHHVRNIRTPDEKDVERVYKALTKELKIGSVFMRKEEDAKKLEEDLKAGGNYEELTKRLIEQGKAEGGGEGAYVKPAALHPSIEKWASNMKVGHASPAVKVPKGYTVFRLEEIRYSEDAEAKETARAEALKQKRVAALEKSTDALFKKYVKVNKKVYDGLDFEADTPGFESLSKDSRVVAEIKGDKPVTVRELTAEIRERFFHGIDRAIREKKINKIKEPVFSSLVMKNVFFVEAKRLKFDQSEEFRYRVREFRHTVVFGVFMEKVIDPEIRIDEAELKSYHAEHAQDFTSPELVKVSSIVFSRREDAEMSIDKLRSGADFGWMKDNVSGQVDEKIAEKQGRMKGAIVVTTGLPAGIREEVKGAAPGDYRFYADPEGYFHVLFIQDVFPARTQGFEQTRDMIRKKLFQEKRERSMEDWMNKLLAAADVRKLAGGNELKEILMRQ